ncbi:MAG: ATP phosphoribosyltransferase regulatory subunit [Rhodospirillales bacterium]|nr:ATP phosphoribosyltransferase regulatory subunit [Rhodospirillales bacterium]
MTDNIADKSLLPAGIRDVLPPDATFEAEAVGRLIDRFALHGYERVKPPLLEFEETLLAGNGAALGDQTFRLMDPESRRMMALRPDMTLQVARIAATRLGRRARPLRLCYSGQVLRVKGTQLRPERQFGQVGAELIGAASAAADVEVILMGIEALIDAGVQRLGVDIGMPTLVPALLAERKIAPVSLDRLRLALDRKDAAAVAELGPSLGAGPGGNLGETLSRMLVSAGPAANALVALADLDLPPAAAAARADLIDVVGRVADGLAVLDAGHVTLTVDPVENRGFGYHTGVGFTFFAGGVRGELGSGGRYRTGGNPMNGLANGEPATGLTLFTDTLLAALPRPDRGRRVYVPLGVSAAVARRLRGEGWATVAALGADADPVAAARAMGCGHIWDTGKSAPVEISRSP